MTQDDTASQNTTTEPQAATATAAQEEDRGFFLPLVFGGAVATALGFFAAQLDSIEAALGLAPETNTEELVADVARQAEDMQAQSDMLAALEARIDGLPQTPPPVDLSGIEAQVTAQAEQIADLAERLETLEKQPMTEGLSESAVAAYEAELTRLQDSVATQRAEIENLLTQARTSESQAQSQAQLALLRATTTRVIAAVETGDPFAGILGELASLGGPEVPAVLSDAASTGVPTLAELQASFAPAARRALAAARSADGDGTTTGLGSFLQRQLGARSVTPQEGNSADAVLSRAEAATTGGDLTNALGELSELNAAGREAMSDWIAQAQLRRDAVDAANALLSEIGTN